MLELKDAYLKHLRAQSVLVKICLGQAFEGIFTTVTDRGRRGDVIKIDGADRGQNFGLGWVTGQYLTDLVNDSVTSSTEGLDDLELDRRSVEIVVTIMVIGGDWEKADPFTVEI